MWRRRETDPTSAAVLDGALVLAHHSLRGADFDARVEAAAAGGFAAIGLNVREYQRLLDAGRTPAQLRAVLDANLVRLAEVEALDGWDVPTAARAPVSRRREELAWAMAGEFGIRHLVAVGSLDGPLGPDPVGGFGALCDRAAGYGVLVALEPLACSAVADLALGLAIVRGAGRPNGGLDVDSWHFTRGGWGLPALAELRPEEVVLVQLDDGPAEPTVPDYLDDTLHHRRVPGDGEFDLVGFLQALEAVGVHAPISVEVISDELDELPPAVAAGRLGDATRAVLARAAVTLAG